MMAPCTKVIGKMVMQLARESFIIQMVISMRANGITIKPMVMEFTLTRKVLDMKVFGEMINSMAKG